MTWVRASSIRMNLVVDLQRTTVRFRPTFDRCEVSFMGRLSMIVAVVEQSKVEGSFIRPLIPLAAAEPTLRKARIGRSDFREAYRRAHVAIREVVGS